MRDGHSGSSQYEGMAGNSSAGGEGTMNIMIPKYKQASKQDTIPQFALGQQPPLHETVVEALAGPSGMQRVSFFINISFPIRMKLKSIHTHNEKRYFNTMFLLMSLTSYTTLL